MIEHLEIEVAANMAYEWAMNFVNYCESVRLLQILEHASGKTIDSEVLMAKKNELKESSDAIMAIAETNDFSEIGMNICLHVEMFYLGIAFITNAQVMQQIQDKMLEGETDLGESNYLYVVNMEQNIIMAALQKGHKHLMEGENESETQPETQSESLEE